MEISEVRQRVQRAIERARQEASARRGRSDTATREYGRFLADRAVPVFHQIASALVAEGHRFKVFTPANSVRLASEHSGEDFIELALDGSQDPPQVIGRTSRGRGRGQVTSERPIRDGVPVTDLTDEHVLDFVLEEIGVFVAR